MDQSPIISIVGMPGAGKSTLAKRLGETFGVRVIVGGDVAREMAKTDPEVASALDAGRFAPKEKMNFAMRKVIQRALLDDEPLLLEGYPRYQEQLDDLQFIAGDRSVFLRLGCNDAVARERMLARQRDDDKPSIIDRRLLEFWTDTYPMFSRMERGAFLSLGTPFEVEARAVQYLINSGTLKWKQPLIQADSTQADGQSSS